MNKSAEAQGLADRYPLAHPAPTGSALPRGAIDETTITVRSRTPCADDLWSVAKRITAERKAGNLESSLAIAEEALESFPCFEPIRSACAWSLYARDIKSLDESADPEALRQGWRSCKRVRELVTDDPYGEFSAWVASVLGLSSALLTSANAEPKRRLRFVRDTLAGLDPGRLSARRFKDCPSPRERHALLLSKALAKLGEWGELRAVCESALAGGSLSEDTVLWLRHRLGNALLALDEAEAAAPHFAFVLDRKPTQWWARFNDGRAKTALGDRSGAVRAFASALVGGALHMKTHVMIALATDLRAQGDVENADRHHLVARQIRTEQGWQSTAEIDAYLAPDSEATPEDRRALETLWESLSAVERVGGEVLKVFENGGAGFLALDRGDSVYFSMPRGRPAPPVGTRVTCQVVSGFDCKKGRASDKAIELRTETRP